MLTGKNALVTGARNVDSDGTVSDEEPRCWEEAMEDGEK